MTIRICIKGNQISCWVVEQLGSWRLLFFFFFGGCIAIIIGKCLDSFCMCFIKHCSLPPGECFLFLFLNLPPGCSGKWSTKWFPPWTVTMSCTWPSQVTWLLPLYCCIRSSSVVTSVPRITENVNLGTKATGWTTCSLTTYSKILCRLRVPFMDPDLQLWTHHPQKLLHDTFIDLVIFPWIWCDMSMRT